jgi:hypothetical protein
MFVLAAPFRIEALPRPQYAYLLGLYLGDGWLAAMARDVLAANLARPALSGDHRRGARCDRRGQPEQCRAGLAPYRLLRRLELLEALASRLPAARCGA